MEPKKSILLRIPPDLARDLHMWARDELRSVNGQIEFVLKQAVNRWKGEKGKEAQDRAAPSDSGG